MIKLTKEMLSGRGSKILATGITTDKEVNVHGWGDRDRKLKFVVAKGFIDDWCVYIEPIDAEMCFDDVASIGNKISPTTALLLVECSAEVLKRYRT